MLVEQVALDSSLNELYFGILTVQNGSAELPVALLLYVGEAKFSRIFGTPVLVNFGTVIVECKNVLLSHISQYSYTYSYATIT